MGATILIPTRDRASYLEVTLASVMPQARRVDAEVLVIDDGASTESQGVAARHGVSVLSTGGRGANAARNAGVATTHGDPVILIDDDIRASPHWLQALLIGCAEYPGHGVFGGPIVAALDGGGPSSCGRESAPVTTLDLGSQDCDTDLVWSANMAIRRVALDQVGRFDETIHVRGDEEDWERRYRASGGRIRYLAGAGVEHRRTGADATLNRLARAAYHQGLASRRFDSRRGDTPTVAVEVRTLLGCTGHVVRYRCPNMLTGVAHSAGRLREAIAEVRQ